MQGPRVALVLRERDHATLRGVVLLWKDSATLVTAGCLSAEGPRDAVVLLERDRATLRDVVLLLRDRATPAVLMERDRAESRS